MHNVIRKSFVIGFSVVGVSLLAHTAQATPLPLPTQALNFLAHNGAPPKDTH